MYGCACERICAVSAASVKSVMRGLGLSRTRLHDDENEEFPMGVHICVRVHMCFEYLLCEYGCACKTYVL